jgi:hypothetical protein
VARRLQTEGSSVQWQSQIRTASSSSERSEARTSEPKQTANRRWIIANPERNRTHEESKWNKSKKKLAVSIQKNLSIQSSQKKHKSPWIWIRKRCPGGRRSNPSCFLSLGGCRRASSQKENQARQPRPEINREKRVERRKRKGERIFLFRRGFLPSWEGLYVTCWRCCGMPYACCWLSCRVRRVGPACSAGGVAGLTGL